MVETAGLLIYSKVSMLGGSILKPTIATELYHYIGSVKFLTVAC